MIISVNPSLPPPILQTYINQYFKDFQQNFFKDFTTFKPQNLYRNKNGYYYLNKKINNKVVKISLKTKDLQQAIFKKDQILKDLLNRNLSLNITINKDKNDTIEDMEDFEERLKEFLSKEKKVKKQEIKTPTNTKKLKETFEEFLDYKLKVDKVSVSSLKNYKSSLNYL